MFDFFDNQKNPFLFMMNMTGNESSPAEEPVADTEDTDPMLFMQQMFMMQMQFMQTMMTLPIQLMQGIAGMMANMSGAAENDAGPKPAPGQSGGFKLGKLNVSPEMLQKLMQMDMSPKNLEKLQRVLDFVFEAMPKSTDE